MRMGRVGIQETFLKKGDAGTSLTCEGELVGKILTSYAYLYMFK